MITADGRIGKRGHPMSADQLETLLADENGHAGTATRDIEESVVVTQHGDLTGRQMPRFESEDVTGKPYRASDLIGRPSALLFTSPDCTGCEVTARELEALKHEVGAELLVVCQAPRDRCGSLAHYYKSEVPVIADEHLTLHRLFGITSLPTVVALDAEGRIESFRALNDPQASEDGEGEHDHRESDLQRLVDEMRS